VGVAVGVGSLDRGRFSPVGGMSLGLPPVVARQAEHSHAITKASKPNATRFTRRDITGRRCSSQVDVADAASAAGRTTTRTLAAAPHAWIGTSARGHVRSLHCGAGVHDDFQASCAGTFGGGFVDHAEL
jgi:hypothetical protein